MDAGEATEYLLIPANPEHLEEQKSILMTKKF